MITDSKLISHNLVTEDLSVKGVDLTTTENLYEKEKKEEDKRQTVKFELTFKAITSKSKKSDYIDSKNSREYVK